MRIEVYCIISILVALVIGIIYTSYIDKEENKRGESGRPFLSEPGGELEEIVNVLGTIKVTARLTPYEKDMIDAAIEKLEEGLDDD